MSRTALRIELSAETRRELEGLARRRRTSQGLARRAQIVLQRAYSRGCAGEGLEFFVRLHATGLRFALAREWG